MSLEHVLAVKASAGRLAATKLVKGGSKKKQNHRNANWARDQRSPTHNAHPFISQVVDPNYYNSEQRDDATTTKNGERGKLSLRSGSRRKRRGQVGAGSLVTTERDHGSSEKGLGTRSLSQELNRSQHSRHLRTRRSR